MSKILVVDDNEQNRYLLRTILNAAKHETLEAENGSMALDLARRDPPDLIVSDILMPHMDGFALCRECKRDEQLRETPFIFYTATYTDPRDRDLGMRLGAARFVIKPIESDELLGIVQDVLEEQAAGRLSAPPPSTEEETVLYRMYNEALVRKLEDKMLALEHANHVLELEIAERRKSEQAFRESEERYQLISSVASDYMFSTRLGADGQLQLDWVAGAFEKITGYTLEEYVAHGGWRATIHPNDLAVDDHDMEKLRSGKRVITEIRTIAKSGEVLWVQVYAHPVMDPESRELVGIYGAVQEITERKRAEEIIQNQLKRLNALREIDQAIRSTFDLRVSLHLLLLQAVKLLSVDAVAVLLLNSVTSSFRYASVQGFRTQTLEDEVIKLDQTHAGRAVLERRAIQVPRFKDVDQNLQQARLLKGEGFVNYHAMPLIVKGQVLGVFEVYHRSNVARDDEWLNFVGTLANQAAIAVDNAHLWEQLQRQNQQLERRVAERTMELNQTNLELEYASHAKDEFLANMSHELRTPLNSILGLAESLLEQRRDPLSEQQQKSLQIIESSGRHLLELINDVLDLSKIEAGKLDYYPQSVDVDTLCRSSLSFVRQQATLKSINLEYVEDTTVANIYADPRRLKQILVNLLTNAVKFTPDSGHVTLHVHADVELDLVQFAVIDNGIGIAPGDLEKLFQPFSQVDSRLNRVFEGTGLGLAIVQKLTDLHGGSVSVKSEAGRGSRFTINLPWRRDLAEQTEAHAPGRPPSLAPINRTPEGISGQNHTVVLLAEDHVANILTIGEYLEGCEYKVEIAHDGWEAIAKAEEINPDIILMDIQMPSLDGLEAMSRLRKNPRFMYTPIIALTALAMPGDRERCIDAGANEYMSKPVSLKKLAETIDTMLGFKNDALR